MDLQTAFNLVVGVLGFLGGWVLNTMWGAIKDMQKNERQLTDKVASIEVLVAGQYIPRSEYANDLASIRNSLGRIERALVGKADRN